MMQKTWISSHAWILVYVAASTAALATLLYALCDVNNVMVQPHNPTEHFGRLVTTLNASWRDLIAPLQEYDHRARFITYFVLLLDYRARIFLYQYFPVFPSFSITWLLTGVLGPYLLYRTCRNLRLTQAAAAAAVLVYVTSTGFLSGFFMFFMPGKPLTLVLFLVICEFVSRRREQLARGDGLVYLWILMLAGCLLDELFFVVIALCPLLLLLTRTNRSDTSSPFEYGWADLKLAAKAILPPLLLFLAVVLVVAPILTQKFYGYRLNYFGALSDTVQLSTPRPAYQLSLSWMAYTLVGVSLIPRQLAALVAIPGSGVETALSITAGGIAMLGMWGTLLVFRVRSIAGPERKRLFVALGAVLLSAALIAVMQGRHVSVVTGYYYGAIFSAVFALCFGIAVSSSQSTSIARSGLAAVLAAALIAAIQIDNFLEINRSFVDYHNVLMPYEGATFESTKTHPLTWAEVSDIHHAWKDRQLSEFLKSRNVSAASWSLLKDLEHIDQLRSAKK